ncbi:MAG: hypothetical protein C0490_09695 [Marivirga sp.]|nr:hypothetical protein [Marivirga sp.]
MDTAAFRFEWESMTAFLMQRMNLEPGEKILLIGKPGKFDPLIPMLKAWIENAKGQYLGVISVDSVDYPEEWSSAFALAAEGKSPDALTEYFKTVDLAIMLPGAEVSHVAYKAMQDVLRGGYGRTIHFHWSGAYSLEGVPMNMNAHIDSVYQSAILSTDYRNVSRLQQYFEESARRQEIRVTTARGTDIRFAIGDRPVTKQDGDASKGRTFYARNLIDREIEIPAGAIRVAPIEESVEGKIAFPDSKWNGQLVKGLVLTFKEGKVIDIAATSGLDAVKEELHAAGPAGYSFREFALGFNPLLAIPDNEPKWIPYYGYGAGVVRLSLGDNTELGGKVGGGYVRWNFFPDATVTLGNAMLVDKGKMLQ